MPDRQIGWLLLDWGSFIFAVGIVAAIVPNPPWWQCVLGSFGIALHGVFCRLRGLAEGRERG